MVNPGAFSGTRQDFLAAQKDLYAEAVTGNHVADTVADIQRRYFKRYPITLPHNEEPSPEWLANVDDNSADDDDLQPPDRALLNDEEFEDAEVKYKALVKLLKFRKDQIARRLNYQHTKDQSLAKRIKVGTEDPMAILMAKLVGVPVKKPRIRTGYNVWGQKNRDFVDPIYDQCVKDEQVPCSKRAALRMRIYKEYFDKLGEDERKDYERQATEEHRAAVDKIDCALNAPPSEDPADRQNILRGLPGFAQPILDLITTYTGWKATLIIGGPEPADQGRLNVMSFHSGETSGNVKMNFGRSERRVYKNFVMPVFGNFLKKCYTVEECRAAAISDPSTTSLADALELKGGEFHVDRADDAGINYVRIAGTPRPDSHSTMPKTPLPPQMPLPHANQEMPVKIGPPGHRRKARSPLGIPFTPGSRPIPQTPSRDDRSPELGMQTAIASCPPSPCQSAVPMPVPSPYGMPEPTPPAFPERLATPPVPPLPPMPSGSPLIPYASTPPIPVPPALPTSESAPTPLRQPPPPPILSASPGSAPTVPSSIMLAPVSQSTYSSATSDMRKRPRSNPTNDELRANDVAGCIEAEDEPRKRLRSSRNMSTHVESPEDTGGQAPVETGTTIKPLTPQELANAPDWFLKAYQMLLSKDFGPAWTQLVRAWAHFEKGASFKEEGKLGTEGRPACIAAWIARARSVTYQPDLQGLLAFERSFGTWWHNLQPEWRLPTECGGALQRQGDNLEVLCRPGKNGLLSVLAALYFWSIYAEQRGNTGWKKCWEVAVDDVQWVINNISGPK